MRKRLIRFSEADPATSRAELLRWIKKRSALLAIFSGVLIFALLLVFWASNRLANRLLASYEAQRSVIMYDRNGRGIAIKPNVRGYYARYAQVPFERFIALLLAKEDRYFYRHVGVNPISIARAGIRYFLGDSRTANSTITQQLVKILLGNEQSRSIKNKIKEVVYAMALELHTSKREILTMYQNSAYFGNRAQGVKEAAQFYFGTESEALSDIEWLALVATLQSPSDNYPGTSDNKTMLSRLALEMGIPNGDDRSLSLSKALSFSQRRDDAAFELETTGVSCKESCHLTIDRELTRSVRAILNRDLEKSSRGVHNGAVIVIKLPENEVLALVGSPNPSSLLSASQINMALEPRPIGSTIKPFIYLAGFQKDLRPYTLVDDREYRYPIGTGFPLYPKNYDYQYHGEVNLHYALANSLNVPSLKVLEHVGLKAFFSFLGDTLGFRPLQPLESYQFGIALGGLEMDSLTLARYMTLFPNEGLLKPLIWSREQVSAGLGSSGAMARNQETKRVAPKEHVELVNRILSDRQTGVEQFGIASSLNLSYPHYAVKTGTSREFLDSWTVGYTPDFLVAVWLGNADNTPPLEAVSGQRGAGEIWHDVMELLLNSPYNKKTPFDFTDVGEFFESGTLEYGFRGDRYEKHRSVLLANDKYIIERPHEGDVFLFAPDAQIHLEAKRPVSWFLNGAFLELGKEGFFAPKSEGDYHIEGRDDQGASERILIHVRSQE